jgi:TolB-like protein
MIKSIFLFLGFGVLLLSGCAKWQGALGIDANLRNVVFASVDELLLTSHTLISDDTKFLVASIVNIDHLHQSSTLGRTMAEYINSCLVQRDFTTSETKLRQSMFVEEEGGEFLLSRDFSSLRAKYSAQAVIVGTYSVGENVVYISLRLVELQNGSILSTSEFEIPLGTETDRLLQNDQFY